MKRLLIMIVGILTMVDTYATGVESIGGLQYLINTDANTATLVGSGNIYGDIVVPEKVTLAGIDYPVVAFAKDCFKNLWITSIDIPASVTSLGSYCFYNCLSLTSIDIPASVTSLGDHCFSGCSSLTSIDIPSSVTSLGDHCFSGCYLLTSIDIPASVPSLGDYCFSGCSSLTSIDIPSSVTSLGDCCFRYCSSLTSIDIPSSVTSLGDYCFSGCSSLTSIDIPSSVTSLGDYCFSGCSSLTSIDIPSSVTSLGDYCFYSCSSLTSIDIPSSVTSLGDYFFGFCSSLTSIDIPSSVTSLGDYCFYNCSSLTSITIPSSVITLGLTCFYECSSLTSITIPSSVKKIDSNKKSSSAALFGKCSKLESVYCYAVTPPTSMYEFEQSNETILYVPSASIDQYKQATGWKDFIIFPISGTESDNKGKCEKPSITFADGNLHFESSTTGANYHYTISSKDMTTEAYSESGEVALQAAYNITAYATADDYSPSDKATATLYWIGGAADDPTGINANTKRGIVVSTQNGTVTLSGLNDGERVSFYSVSGSNLGAATANNGTATSTFATGQIIIAKVGNTSVKIAL